MTVGRFNCANDGASKGGLYRIPIPLPHLMFPLHTGEELHTIDGFERFRRLPEPLFAIFDFKVHFQIGDFEGGLFFLRLQHS